MNKPAKSYPRPLSELVGSCVGDAFARQGFASVQLVTHWPDIVGEDIAALAEPLKMVWRRPADNGDNEPATLILRVEGPAAVEVQHLTPVILAQVNRFLGWRAVGKIGLRQAPLMRTAAPVRPSPPTQAETEAVKGGLAGFGDEGLRDALARLGVAVNRP